MVRVKHRYLLVKLLYPDSSFTASLADRVVNVTPKPVSGETSLLLPSPLKFHAPTPDSVTVHGILKLLRHQITQLFGEYGSGIVASSLSIKYWSNATSTFIVRCARSCERLVWASITYITALPLLSTSDYHGGRKPAGGKGLSDIETELGVVMRVMRVSGTIRKCQEEAIRQARVLCGRAKGLKAVIDGGLSIEGTRGSGTWNDEVDEGDGTDEEKGEAREEGKMSLVDHGEEQEESEDDMSED